MGQYFSWVNLDKREFIEDDPWICGLKLIESCYVGNEKTDAALTLLESRWAGDRVVFLGDYASFANETDPFRKAFELELGGKCPEDFMLEELEDITGLFAYVRDCGRNKHYDWDTESYRPYEGPFDIEIVDYRFVVDETLKEFVDRATTPVRYISESGEITRYDPVPELMSSENETGRWGEHVAGRWFGHEIRPAHNHPGEGYAQVATKHTYWDDIPIITATDEEIRAAIARASIVLDGREMEQLFSEIEAVLVQNCSFG